MENNHHPFVKQLITFVAEKYEADIDKILKPSKGDGWNHSVVEARKVCCYLFRQYGYQMRVIAAYMNCALGAVCNSVKWVEIKVDDYPGYKKMLDKMMLSLEPLDKPVLRGNSWKWKELNDTAPKNYHNQRKNRSATIAVRHAMEVIGIELISFEDMQKQRRLQQKSVA